MKKALKKLWKNEFVRGGTIFTAASFLVSIINYLFNLLAARGLGPVGFSEITALSSYLSISGVPTLVITLIIVQKIGSKGELSKSFALSLQEWFSTTLTKWWFLAIPILSLSFFIPQITNLSPIVGYFLIPLMILSFVGAFYGAVFQGLKYFTWFSIISVSAILLKLLGPILLLLRIDGLMTIMMFLLASSLLGLFFSHIVIKKNVMVKKTHMIGKINKRFVDILFNKQVIITFLSILALTSFNNIDVVFVKKFFNSSDAGIYGAWSLFSKMIFYLIGPVIAVSFVFFSHKKKGRDHERVLFWSLIILSLIAILSFISYKYFSSLVIRIFFGSKFLRVAPHLAAASIFGSLYTTITFINNYFLAKKSLLSLTLMILIPVYFILLFSMPRTLNSIIALNIYFSFFVTVIYLIACSRWVFYNMTDEKKKR